MFLFHSVIIVETQIVLSSTSCSLNSFDRKQRPQSLIIQWSFVAFLLSGFRVSHFSKEPNSSLRFGVGFSLPHKKLYFNHSLDTRNTAGLVITSKVFSISRARIFFFFFFLGYIHFEPHTDVSVLKLGCQVLFCFVLFMLYNNFLEV